MLTGQALGAAIEKALAAKGLSKTDAARRYGVRNASVTGWIKTGRIATDKLLDIMDFCSDVLGPEHWGLDRWPGRSRPLSKSLPPLPADEQQLLAAYRAAKQAGEEVELARAEEAWIVRAYRAAPEDARRMLLAAAKSISIAPHARAWDLRRKKR